VRFGDESVARPFGCDPVSITDMPRIRGEFDCKSSTGGDNKLGNDEFEGNPGDPDGDGVTAAVVGVLFAGETGSSGRAGSFPSRTYVAS
jgi:hypothetical protein